MKLYVLVNRKLSKSQQAIQAGHAVAEFCRYYPSKWDYSTLVYLQVNDVNSLRWWLDTLYMTPNVDTVSFIEPYWNNQLTAVAACGEGLDNLLAGLPLL